MDNLVMLCRRHHHLVHEGGFVCEKAVDGELVFRDQRQQPLASSATLQSVSAQDVDRWMDSEFFEAGIDIETCAAKWHAGTQMDWHAAVGSLFNRV